MKKTGELLKKAREEKKLSLHEIGLSLKISSKVLKAIEEGDEKQLPAKTFLRGFVQSYANFLHLDSEKVLEVFYEEVGSTRYSPYIRSPESERPPSAEDLAAQAPVSTPLRAQVNPEAGATEEKPTEASVTPLRRKLPESRKADGMQSLQENKTTKTLAIVVVGMILVGLIIFTKKMIDKYSKEAEVPSAEVAQTMEGATPVIVDSPISPDIVDSENESTSEAKPAASPLSSITDVTAPIVPPVVSSQAKPTPTPSPAAAAAATPTPTPTPKPTVTPKVETPVAVATPVPTVAASASPSPSPTPSPTTTPKPEVSKPVELIVEALDTVEIEYSSPSGKLQKIKLSSEQVHTFKSRSGLKINFSNGGAVNLILNGKDIGIPGDLGKPIKLSY